MAVLGRGVWVIHGDLEVEFRGRTTWNSAWIKAAG
jgi:hypothetical protein